MSAKNLSQDEVSSLPKSLIQVGIPISFPIYDIKGQLLMQKGTVVTSEDQLERLQERGLYLDKKTIDQLPSSQPLKKTNKQKEAEASEPQEQLVDFNLYDIPIGESLHISPLTDETNSTKYIVKFLGGLEKGGIICSAPKLNDKLVFVKEGAGFLFRAFSGKEMYNFTSIITAIYNQPYPHIHLKFPQGVYTKNFRRHHRAKANIITSIVNKTSDALKNSKLSGRMLDVSLGGASVSSSALIGNENDEVECKFKLELFNEEVFFLIPCILKKTEESSELERGQKYRHGLQFKEIPFEDKIMLQNFIYQKLNRE